MRAGKKHVNYKQVYRPLFFQLYNYTIENAKEFSLKYKQVWLTYKN